MVIFDAFKKNSVGVWWFCPDEPSLYRKKKPCYGFGQIKYLEGSVYTGRVFFDGKNYLKKGKGQQDFTTSCLSQLSKVTNEKLYKFVGNFNDVNSAWIHGNGVKYYVNSENKPTHFQIGYFSRLDKKGEYRGEFDYDSLLDGYDKSMQFEIDERAILIDKEKENIKNIDRLDNLFIGDSYFELWNYEEYSKNTFYNVFKNSLNLGLGGTRFYDWIPYVYKLKDLKAPKNIIINLGFNDIHCEETRRAVQVHLRRIEFLKLLRDIFPDSNYYFVNVVHAPLFKDLVDVEEQLNRYLESGQTKYNYKVIDNCLNIASSKENPFFIDLVHLNHHGYELFESLIKKYI